MKRYKRVEFKPCDLSEAAFYVYCVSSFVFYKSNNEDEEDVYFVEIDSKAHPYELGALRDVEAFLLQFVEEE